MTEKYMLLEQLRLALLRAKLDYTGQISQIIEMVSELGGGGVSAVSVALKAGKWRQNSSSDPYIYQTAADPTFVTGEGRLYLVCGDQVYAAAGIEAKDITTNGEITFRCGASSAPTEDLTALILRLEVA